MELTCNTNPTISNSNNQNHHNHHYQPEQHQQQQAPTTIPKTPTTKNRSTNNLFNLVSKLTNEANMFAKLLSPKSSKLSSFKQQKLQQQQQQQQQPLQDFMNRETTPLDNGIKHSSDHNQQNQQQQQTASSPGNNFNDPLSKLLLERIRLLEEENSNLIAESEQQRVQYEKCLDDVAASVVNALLSQKNLRQECIQLRRRVRELEQQNQLLSLVLEEQLVTSSNNKSSKSDNKSITSNNFTKNNINNNNNHIININNNNTLNNTTSTCFKDSTIVNNHHSSLGVVRLISDKLDGSNGTNKDEDDSNDYNSSRSASLNDNFNDNHVNQTNVITNKNHPHHHGYISSSSSYPSSSSPAASTSSSNSSMPPSSSSTSGLSEMALQFEQALSSLMADSSSPIDMLYHQHHHHQQQSSTTSNKLSKDATLYSNESNFPNNFPVNSCSSSTSSSQLQSPLNNQTSQLQITTTEARSRSCMDSKISSAIDNEIIIPSNVGESRLKTLKSSFEQVEAKLKLTHEDKSRMRTEKSLVIGDDKAGYYWQISSYDQDVDGNNAGVKEAEADDVVSGLINRSNRSSTGLRQLTRPSRESFLTSLKTESSSSPSSSPSLSNNYLSLSANSNGASILPHKTSSLGQGQSIPTAAKATATTATTITSTVTSSEPEKLFTRLEKEEEPCETDCLFRSIAKQPLHLLLNNRNHNVDNNNTSCKVEEEREEARSSPLSGNCLSSQSMSETNSMLGCCQSNVIDRRVGETVQKNVDHEDGEDITLTQFKTTTVTATTTPSATTLVSTKANPFDCKLKSSSSLIDATKVTSSNQIHFNSFVKTSSSSSVSSPLHHQKSASNSNLVLSNCPSILSSSTNSSTSSSSTLPPSSSSSSSTHSSTSALIGSPCSPSSCLSLKKSSIFHNGLDNASETSNLVDSSSPLFHSNSRSNQQEKRILFILASNQPNSSSTSSSSSSSFSSASSSSSFSIEKSCCDIINNSNNNRLIKPSNLDLRTLTDYSSGSKSIPSLDKDSPISGETSSDTNGELTSKDEGYSTMSSDVQSDATLGSSGSSFHTSAINHQNTTTTSSSSNATLPINNSTTTITKSSNTENNSGKTILIEKQNSTTSSKPLSLSTLLYKQGPNCETIEIRSGANNMGVNGSTTGHFPATLSPTVNPIVVDSCRFTTFKDLPDNCTTMTARNNASYSSSSNNNNKMAVLREEEDCLEKDTNQVRDAMKDSSMNNTTNTTCFSINMIGGKSICKKSPWFSNCDLSAIYNNSSDSVHVFNFCEIETKPSYDNSIPIYRSSLKQSHRTDFIRKSTKRVNHHPHRYTFPPTSRDVTIDGIECTPCVISDFKPSLKADFKSIGFPCNQIETTSNKLVYENQDWHQSRLVNSAEKAISTDSCDKDGLIYSSNCDDGKLAYNNVKIKNEKLSSYFDGHDGDDDDGTDGKISQAISKSEVDRRATRKCLPKGEIIITATTTNFDDKEFDVNMDRRVDEEIVTFKLGKPEFKRKAFIQTHCDQRLNKPGSSQSSSSSSYGSYSLSRSYSDSQLYSDSKEMIISSISRKQIIAAAVHEASISSCKRSSGVAIRRRVKRDERARNQSLRWSTLSTSSSALSDGLEAPICCERRRCRPRPIELPNRYISSDENHSADDEDSHEKFVTRWLRNGTGGLRWDDSEVTWKLNESLDWPESIDLIKYDFSSSKKDDTFEEIPLLDDGSSESDKVEIVTSVLPSSSKGDISSDQASSVLDENLVPETNFNGDFYRLCSVGSKTSLPEAPGPLSSASLADVKEHEAVSVVQDNNSAIIISMVKGDENNDVNNDNDVNKSKAVQRQYMESPNQDDELLVITTDIVENNLQQLQHHVYHNHNSQSPTEQSSELSAAKSSPLSVKTADPVDRADDYSNSHVEMTHGSKSEIDNKIVPKCSDHIPSAPEERTGPPSFTSPSTASPTKSLSSFSSNLSVKPNQSGQSIVIDKCNNKKFSTINTDRAITKEKKPPRKILKSPSKESTATTKVLQMNNSTDSHNQNAKDRSTSRDINCTRASSENFSREGAVLATFAHPRPTTALVKSSSVNCAKLSSSTTSTTRIPMPKQSNSFAHIKKTKDVKSRQNPVNNNGNTNGCRYVNGNNLTMTTTTFSSNSKSLDSSSIINSNCNNLVTSISLSSSPTINITNNSRQKSAVVEGKLSTFEPSNDHMKQLDAKIEKRFNRSCKSNDETTNQVNSELKSPKSSAPSVEDLERRLSEDKQMSEKIKEFYSLFEERQLSTGNVVETQSNESKVTSTSNTTGAATTTATNTVNSEKPVLDSIIQSTKLNYPKAILRRSKAEPSKTMKEGHETSWVHVSGFSVRKVENLVEKPSTSTTTTTTTATIISNHNSNNNIKKGNQKNLTGKMSSDSCSSDDEVNFHIEGKKRSSFHQRLLALHRSRRQRKRASGRYMGMGFLPRIRASIVDRLDFYHRFGEKEQSALSSFNFLNELPISPLTSSSSSSSSSALAPYLGSVENFEEEQRLLIRYYLNSLPSSLSSSQPSSFTSKWPQSQPSPPSSSFKPSPSRHQLSSAVQSSISGNSNYIINDHELGKMTGAGADHVNLITSNGFV